MVKLSNVRKLLALAVAIIFVLSLAACGGTGGTSQGTAAKESSGVTAAGTTKEQTKAEAPKPEKKLNIGVACLELANPFFADWVAGIKKELADKAVVTVVECKNNAATQVTQLEQFTAAKDDGIILLAVDPVATLPAVKKRASPE